MNDKWINARCGQCKFHIAPHCRQAPPQPWQNGWGEHSAQYPFVQARSPACSKFEDIDDLLSPEDEECIALLTKANFPLGSEM
ncbi:hypothetical protein [uncultured Paraglaciecola sp.]|uniref:hypothetical protein n=1 Tax=uncultured Paraglaciecola sp. TaxID=1765024 RepID=UPI002638DCF0|nr:hypothetical protein [uncultured Paraglaciecola sp.]